MVFKDTIDCVFCENADTQGCWTTTESSNIYNIVIIQATQTVGMASQLQGSYEEQEERKNEIESLTLIDLDQVLDDNDDDDESADCGFVSPRQLTKINFRSLIGHTDEVIIVDT